MNELGRLEELLLRHATEGLTGSETMELRRLLAARQGGSPEDAEALELAAAALDLALSRSEEPMPEHLRQRLARRARAELRGKERSDGADAIRSRPRGRSTASAALPWLAAAAALLVALVGWWPRLSPTTEVLTADIPVTEQRSRLAALPGAVSRDWTATGDPAAREASGDVVWSDAEQRGFMRIRGLAANEPTREQYQLWIFDRDRDERYPVDGGVFDVPAGAGEVLVPIDAKLAVRQPTLFAVTVEPPGGVVVSSRERIVLVAEV